MEQLIQQLTEQFNLSEEEATSVIDTVKNYVPANGSNENSGEETEKQNIAMATPVAEKQEGMFEKAEHFVTDHIPGGLKEKAEEMLGGIGDKVKGLFS